MAEPPPSGTGQQDKSYFKNSVAKDGKVRIATSPPPARKARLCARSRVCER